MVKIDYFLDIEILVIYKHSKNYMRSTHINGHYISKINIFFYLKENNVKDGKELRDMISFEIRSDWLIQDLADSGLELDRVEKK